MTLGNNIQPTNDSGYFTIQSFDIPLGVKTKTKPRFTKAEVKPKKARLTPINENEEFDKFDYVNDDKSEISFDSMRCEEDFAMEHNSAFNDIDDNILYHSSTKRALHRTDTPVLVQRRKKKSSHLAERIEKELRNITEQSDQEHNDATDDIITDLPPRPKARLEVLPPDITGNHSYEHKRKRRMRKVRHKDDAITDSGYKNSNSISNFAAKEGIHRNKLSLLSRPQSADSGVKIIKSVTLPKIQKSISTSVPDLPTVMNKLAKSKLKGQSTSYYEDNGALGTPREPQKDRRKTKCLVGSDMSSFYNMWEKSRTSRVIGRQSPEKMNSPSPSFQRSCAHFHKHETRKHHFLPPL